MQYIDPLELKELNKYINWIAKGDIVIFNWKNEDGWPVEFVSENVKRILGYSSEEFTNGTIIYEKLIHPDDLKRVISEVEKNSKQKVSWFNHKDYRLRRSDGDYIWVYDSTVVVYDENKKISNYFGYVVNVTDRHDVKKQLEESETKFRETSELVPVMINEMKLDGTITYANRYSYEKLKYTKKDIANGLSVFDCIRKEDYQDAKKMIQSVVINQKTTIPEELVLIAKDGKEVDVIASIAPIIIDGKVTGLRNSITDITRLKHAENKLKRHSRFLEQFNEINEIFTNVKDINKLIPNVLKKIRKMFGTERAFLMHPCNSDAEFLGVTHEDTKRGFRPTPKGEFKIPMTKENRLVIEKILDSSEPIVFGKYGEYPLPSLAKKKHAKTKIAMRILPLTGSAWILGMHNCIEDKNWSYEERSLFKQIGHKIEDAISSLLYLEHLRESEKKFRETVELLPSVITEINLDGKVTYANKVAKTVLGYSEKDVQKGINVFNSFRPDYHQLLKENIAHILAGENFDTHEYIMLTKSGKEKEVFITSSLILKNGKPSGIRSSITDVTRIRKTEKELEDLNKNLEEMVHDRTAQLQEALAELKQLDLLKDSFLSNVSHELRTPMTTIRTYVQLLSSGGFGKVDRNQEDALKIILNSVDQQIQLINDLLDISRFEAGRANLHFEKRIVTPLVEEIVNEFKPVTTNIEGKIKLRIKGKPKKITFDEDKIRRLLRNIIGNSIKYKGASPLVIQVIVTYNPSCVNITIKDNGIGISKEDQKHIFDKFYQVDASKTRQVEGSGLGLSIVNEIAKVHGARIKIKSDVGKGTSFSLCIPYKKREQDKILIP